MSMAVKQEIKTEANQSQSQQLFPLLVSTEQSSLNYMKRLTAVAISNILYIRNVFSEECYGHRKLDHLKLRMLTERCDTVGAKQIVNWVKGCFDAMEKKYLKQLTLGIYTDPSEPEELIEAYTFRFSYDSNQFNCDISLNQKTEIKFGEKSATSELRTATIQLMRSLIIMVQSLDKLPNECYLTMKLLYYDDITPQDYEPPGFMPSDKDSFTFKGRPISISAGEVVTALHTLKVKIRTNQEQFQDFDPSQSSDRVQELNDECSPLEIDNSFSEDREERDESENKSEDSSQNKNKKSLVNSFQKKSKSPKNLTKNFIKQEVIPQSVTNKDRNKSKAERMAQKVTESKVISKIKEMKVNDKNTEKENKHSISGNKRKDYEVTQDSVFNSMPNADKRFKASKADKTFPIRNRR